MTVAHIDRFIYEYYGNRLNNRYNEYMKEKGISRASTAYRNCTPGKCNIDFAKEVFEFIVKSKSAYVFVGDFSKFFDKLDHKYLKDKIKNVIGENALDEADYAIYKNITKFAYIEADDIESEKGTLRKNMRKLDKYFETEEFHDLKKKSLHKNNKDYQIPQGSSISAVYANVYMVDFDKKINDYVTTHKGMYRRYCDDIIIVIPMTYEEMKNGENEEIAKFVYKIRDSIPNLELNEDKTEHFYYGDGTIEKIMGESNLINYLGFKSDFVLAAGLITFITVFLMIFSMKYYMKLRIKDYTTFIVLGMKKKTSYLLLLVEYTVGCVFSLVFGILMGNGILYGAQTALHKLYPEFLKVTAPGWKIYRNTCGMSVANMTGVFLILLVWMDGRNLSTLISKSEYNEKRPVGKKWILMVLIGIGVLVLGENQYQGSDLSYMYSHVIFIVGLFLVAAFGVALILEGLKHRKQFYHRHILQMNQLYSKYMNNLLILLILLVIHFFALTYLTVEIAEVLPLDKYRENYPYDMVWMAKEEDEAFAEKLVRKYDGNMTELPMIRVTTYYGAQHIGVSASEYEKLTGKDVNLSEREILVGIEDSEYQKEKKITDEDYLNTYSFLFTGKYQEDMAEISHTDPQYLYDIKDIFTQNVIGQYSTDQWHENIIVFSDTYFQKQWEAMRGDDQEATVLRLFTFSGKRKENAWKELSEYQKECGVKNDSDTRMESYLYGTEEYLIGQKMRVLFSLSSKLFLMMALFISAFFVNGIKILSELSGYERRYEFLRCMGMKQKQRRKTIRFETQMLSDIALFATVMMGIVYVLSYEWRCASKDAGSLDVTFWMYWILIVGIYLLADRLVQWLFAQYVIKRVEKGND